MIVVDASAALHIVLRTPLAAGLELRLFGGQEPLHAPHLIDLELTQALRRLVRSGSMAETHAGSVLDVWRTMPVARHGSDLLLPRIWELRDVATAYDAAYIALAETLHATLVTTDAKFARTGGRLATVEVFPPSPA